MTDRAIKTVKFDRTAAEDTLRLARAGDTPVDIAMLADQLQAALAKIDRLNDERCRGRNTKLPGSLNPLSDAQLTGMWMWDRDVMLAPEHRAVGSFLVAAAVDEIRDHRAATAKLRAQFDTDDPDEIAETVQGVLKERDKMQDERDAARAEVERMRPVVNACVRVVELDETCDQHPRIDDPIGNAAESEMYPAVRARTLAVNAYRNGTRSA